MEGVSRGANLKHQKQTKHKNVEKKVEKKITRTEEIAMFPNLHERKLENISRRRYKSKSKYENLKILFKV